MNLLLHVSSHWGGQFSTFEWLLVIAVIAITTVFLFNYAFWKKTNPQPILTGNQVLYENRRTRSLLTKFFLIYTLMAVGMALQIGGGKWDVTWHILQRPETFFTPPHAVLYAGVALTVSAAGAGLYLKLRSKQKTNGNLLLSSSPSLFDPIFFAVIGSTMQIIAGIFDFSWHNTFGFDGLLSPPHALLVSGMVINSLAAAKGLNTILNQVQYSPTRIIAIITLALSLAVLWMCSVALMDLYTYPWSEGEHFNFNPDPQMAALGATIGYPLIGPFIAMLTLSVLPIKYPFTLVTGLYLSIIFLANILPDPSLHGSMPYYALNILIAFAIDNIYKAARFIHNSSKAKAIVIGSLFGPFFISMYFPGIIAVYQEPLGLAEEELGVEDVAFAPLIYQTDVRIVLIPSILAGIIGSVLGRRAGKIWSERTTLSSLLQEEKEGQLSK
jgi:hypothetical protein